MKPSSVAVGNLERPDVDSRQVASNGGGTVLDGALVLPDLDFGNFGGEYLEWDNADDGFTGFLNTQMNDPNTLPGPLLPARHSTPLINQTVSGRKRCFSDNPSIPGAPTFTVRSLVQRPKMQAGAQRIANLILHTLKSYPLMMLRLNTLPPFVHPSLVSGNVENVHMEPVTICISLVHMISSGVLGSRKLFWKNVRLECERLSEEVHMPHDSRCKWSEKRLIRRISLKHWKPSKWELLAALQALSIYILIRLDEGETDHNNFDFLLVKTVIVSLAFVCSLSPFPPSPLPLGLSDTT